MTPMKSIAVVAMLAMSSSAALIISSNGSVSAVVIGVGGFLGLGEKMVAMPFNALSTEKGDNNSLKIKVEGTKESLKSMPDYKYSS